MVPQSGPALGRIVVNSYGQRIFGFLRRQSYLLPSFLIGIASFLYLFGPLRAVGIGGAYDHPGSDLAQHIAGAYAYLDGSWTFPLFHTDRINAPGGANIIFTDSAPFAGLIAKIINSLTGLRWNYIGTWFFVLWVLQPVSGSFLARQLGANGWFTPTLIGLIVLMCPFFLLRHGHLALSSHFLILLSLGFYFKDTLSLRLSAYCWAAILGVAIWTHAYLYVICLAIFGAAVCDIAIFRRSAAIRTFVNGAAVITFTIMLALIGGYGSGSGVMGGYSILSADILSMVWPTASWIIQVKSPFIDTVAFEGNNYLGLGGLLAVLLAVLFARKSTFQFLRKHPALIFIVGICAFYALGNVIRIAGTPIFEYSIPENTPPYSVFRASGRLMWPLSYLVMFLSFKIIVDASKSAPLKSVVYVTLIALAIVQITDSRILINYIVTGLVGKDRDQLAQLVQKVEKISFLMPLDCPSNEKGLDALTEASWVAAKAGKLTDSARLARHSEPLTCKYGKVSEDAETLSIASVEAFKFVDLPRDRCTQLDDIYACGAVVAQMPNFHSLPERDPYRLSLNADQLVKFTQVGYLDKDVLKNRGSGMVFFGPYVAAPAGEYQLFIDADISGDSSVIVDVVSNAARDKHAEADIVKLHTKTLRFKLETMVSNLEVRMTSSEGANVSVRGYTLNQLF